MCAHRLHRFSAKWGRALTGPWAGLGLGKALVSVENDVWLNLQYTVGWIVSQGMPALRLLLANGMKRIICRCDLNFPVFRIRRDCKTMVKYHLKGPGSAVHYIFTMDIDLFKLENASRREANFNFLSFRKTISLQNSFLIGSGGQLPNAVSELRTCLTVVQQ